MTLAWRVATCTLATLALMTACGDGGARRREAEQLMNGITQLQDETSLGARQAGLDALKKLPLTAAEHRQLRDVCVVAHRQLLDAEIEQADARKAMEEAVPPGSGAKLDKADAEKIGAAIERSNAALSAAQKRFPECQNALQGLLEELR